jgi:pyrimidine-nucleoside phosphorylase
MIPAELITRKREGHAIPAKDLETFIQGYVAGTIPDYQMSAFLMAVFFQGMAEEELFSLVEIMISSGRRLDFSYLKPYVADKHSTGGVGDKVSLILAPLLSAAGLAIPMLSGRGLGHTGGTLDKLETIPGFKTALSLKTFQHQVESYGLAIMGQTEDICPADRKMYALRDVTGTVPSIPLICGSIMSKKIAEGIQGLVIDIKTGNGAFMKTQRQAQELAKWLVKIGKRFGVETDVVFTSMDQPLGRNAGLWCEVVEAIECLQDKGPDDTMEVTYILGARLLLQAGLVGSIQEGIKRQKDLIADGKAFEKLQTLVEAQGGDVSALEHYQNLHQPRYQKEILAPRDGYIQEMNTYQLGMAAVQLGCGRLQTGDSLDPTAGMTFCHKIGDAVNAGEPLLQCFNSNQTRLELALETMRQTIVIGDEFRNHQLILNNE